MTNLNFKNQSLPLLLILFSLFLYLLPASNNSLICEPTFLSAGDNYTSEPDDQDEKEYKYGYEFAHRAGDKEYYDHWKGIYWDTEKFAFQPYVNKSNATLVEVVPEDIPVYSDLDNSTRSGDYVDIEHNTTNLLNLHNKAYMTSELESIEWLCNNSDSTSSDGTDSTNTTDTTDETTKNYGLLITMDENFAVKADDLASTYDFYFTIENPYDYNATFAFKVRNFVNTSHTCNTTVPEYGPNMSECIEEEKEEEEKKKEETKKTDETGKGEECDEEEEDCPPDEQTGEKEKEEEKKEEEITPCEREIIIISYTYPEWEEDFPIPEVFYITQDITIAPHSHQRIKVPLTFELNTTTNGYHVINEKGDKSDVAFYWPQDTANENGKVTNMEIILESDQKIGLSTYSLMRRREKDVESYLGKNCYVKAQNLSGQCGDGYRCEETCKKCEDITCKDCDKNDKCSKCFMTAVEGQWNVPGGNKSGMDCDLDYFDIAHATINGGKKIEVPPAIHWRVTTDFWIWITDPKVIYGVNMNIIYKDFFAITMTSTQDGLKIYATPIEWLYEYPTTDDEPAITDSTDTEEKYIYENYIKDKDMRNTDIEKFLDETVGSLNKVTLKDVYKKPRSTWIYVRFAFDLDISKMYLNDLPESNLLVGQLYKTTSTTQTNLAFHMKKFYEKSTNTYLYFQNFKLSDKETAGGKNTQIYIRNFNVFREYIPQNVITKFHNMHEFKNIEDFPHLLFIIPFANVKKVDTSDIKNRKFKAEAYTYYIRDKTTGLVKETGERQTDTYEIEVDDTVKTLRPPRNFWRLNFLNINKQAKTCDFDVLIDLICKNPPNQNCFEDNTPYNCALGTEEKPYYLDIVNLKCQQYCELNYMRPPRYDNRKYRLYCSHLCDKGFKQCPSDDYKYTEINSNFLCSNNFFNLYYKCYSKDDTVNNKDYSGLYFGKFLRTPSMQINLENTYTQFAVDFWYYPDILFRQKRYPPKEKFDPDDHEEPATEKERVIFYTNAFKVIVEKDSWSYSNIKGIVNGKEAGTLHTSDYINFYNWNHFIFGYYTDVDGTKRFYGSFGSRQYRYELHYYYWSRDVTQGFSTGLNLELSKIIFCNMDKVADTDFADCETTEWLDGFYKKIQVFDITFSQKNPIYFMSQFEDDGVNGMIRHRYIYGLNTIVNNKLQDTIGGKHGKVLFSYDTLTNQNPDQANFIVYQTNFCPQAAFYSSGREKKYLQKYNYDHPPVIEITVADSASKNDPLDARNCDLMQSSTTCLSCKEGFALYSRQCLGDIEGKRTTGDYVYKNPGIKMPERISLNLDFDKIKTSQTITIFFFIKIYGFVTKDTNFADEYKKLIILHETKDVKGNVIEEFYLGYDHADNQRIFFQWNNLRLYSYEKFRELHFGHWIPISFAAFRENDRLFKLNMCQCSINYSDLPFDTATAEKLDEYPYIQFTQFSITNKWVGLISNIRIYNRFLVNAWGIVKHFRNTKDDDDVPDSIISEISMKSEDSDSCLKVNQILNQPTEGYKTQCVEDFNEHLDSGARCGSLEAHTVWWDQNTEGQHCHSYCGTHGYYPTRCLGGNDATAGAYTVDNMSCETQSPMWKNFYPYEDTAEGKIKCGILYKIDFNRFQHAEVTNIASPQDTWNMDFWFYSGSCRNVYKLKEIYDKNNRNNNFKSIVLEWNYHVRIKVYTVKKTDDPEKVDYEYFISCQPVIVLEHPDLDSDDTYTNNLGVSHYKWLYVSCGINFSTKTYYQTNNNKMGEERSFTSKLTTIPEDKTTFYLNEYSKSGYGFTFIRQIRLWGCYDCAHPYRNFRYEKDDFNFNAVYHCWRGLDGGKGPTASFADAAGNAPTYEMVQSADFAGYTLMYGNPDVVLCDESIWQYYNDNITDCERQFNLARKRNDFQISIPSSRNARYSMEFWFFIENSAELSPGFNLVWINHMSITLLRDTSNKNTINAICFPQNYRENVDGKGGQDIIDLYDEAINAAKHPFYQGSSTWSFIRCSVDQTRKLFFVGETGELDLEGETLYGTTKNYRPFRYFKISSSELLKFQNAYHNPTRIFIRQVRTYREYMDYRLMDMKYIRCDYFKADPCEFWPITFCFDIADKLESGNWPCTDARRCFYCYVDYSCGLMYHLYSETSSDSYGHYNTRWASLLRDEEDIYYSTYPAYPEFYRPDFCLPNQSGGLIRASCTGQHLNCKMSDNRFFFPREDYKYIDLTDLTKVTDNCEPYCRLPDSNLKRAYCLFEQYDNNNLNCPYTVAKANTYSKYYDNFECNKDAGYSKVYYECIDNSILSNSAMYFSNVYSFQNIVYSTTKIDDSIPYATDASETRLPSYYAELWFKLDAINYRQDADKTEHYLYIYPHQIIKDSADQKFKYSNLKISNGAYYYTLTAISNYEWNKVIIENLYDPDTSEFSIKFYLNYEFDNPEVEILNLDAGTYKLHFRGAGFCDRTDSYCRINNEPAYLHWGVGWYRNLRIWDGEITSLQLIQACEYGYTQLITAQKYYWPLTADTIEHNYLKDKIQNAKMVHNYWYFHTTDDYVSEYDDAMRENYSTDNFDYTFINYNNYISGISSDGTEYIISACSQECKRCYSSSNNDCYECRSGYAIYGKQCKVRSGYFFKTPPNKDIDTVPIITKSTSNNFELGKQTLLTITIYIKYFGINLEKVVNGKIYYPLICLYDDATQGCITFIGYNFDEKTLVFVIKGEEIYSVKAKEHIGVWTLFGISFRKADLNTEYSYFPHMLNFMVDQEVLINKLGFLPTTGDFSINNFIIHTIPVCYYSSLKFFSTFYFGPYGHINALSSTRGTNLIHNIKFYGSTSTNCVTSSETTALSGNEIICISDYIPYEDSNNICSSNSYYMDVIFKTTPPCELCDSQCITNCFDEASTDCTCDYYEGLYWVKTDENYQSYECQKVDSINFAFFEPVNITKIKLVENDEMTMAFWLDIYEYKDGGFDSLIIAWNRHLAVVAKGIGEQGANKKMEIECWGDYDFDDLTKTVTVTRDKVELNKWHYIVCQADKYHKVIRINGNTEETYIGISYAGELDETFLSIEDTTKDFNYGFSFVRELKLFSSYNFDFWDDSKHNLQPAHFDYLLHSFTNRFSGADIEDSSITDLVTGGLTDLTLKKNRIGYNYVIGYENLILCEEGYVFNSLTNECDIYNSNECYVPRTSNDKCLRCASEKPYLKDDDACYADCSPNYYADDYLKQCRKCDPTCYTCTGKYYNNCTSCTGIYYYIASLHICVTNCQEYGLVSTKPNVCDDLITGSNISVPVYLNNSYDYNKNNADYKSKIVNRDIFNKIVGHISFNSSSVEIEWEFSRNDTLNESQDYRYFDPNDIPTYDPITSDHTKLDIDVDNSFFKYGYRYVFYLNLISRNDKYEAKTSHKYILIMNDYPIVGQINVLPSLGYISNLYLMTINKCTDDYSNKTNLKYKFSYFAQQTDIVAGFTSSTKEVIIQDWSSNSEVLYQFPNINQDPNENYTYYVKGYCKDEWGVYYSDIQNVQVFDIPTSSGVDIPLKESLATIDVIDQYGNDVNLTEEQLSNRAEFLATTTVDYPKTVEILNRTNVTDFTKQSIWQQNLILYDPVPSQPDLFCNLRGDSYVEYYYLICHCSGYTGSMCQVDYDSLSYVRDIYYRLFTKVKSMQTGTYSKYLLNAVHKLIKGSAYFMPIENKDFMLDSIDFLNLYRNKFVTEMMAGNNYEIYFDIYNNLIEYGLAITNLLKYQNFISKNSDNNGVYNKDLFRNATLNEDQIDTVKSYFNEVKESLENLLEFYTSNKKEIRFINRNINVYVSLINENFVFDTFYDIEKKLYEPYIDFRQCLEKTMIASQGNPSYKVFLNMIIWKVSPYMSDKTLYWDTASPIISFKFINYDTGKKMFLSDCGDVGNYIQLFFPVNTYLLPAKINRLRQYLSPEDQYSPTDDIFNDPVYINSSGAVFNTTPEERQANFFLGFNFSCEYYKVSSEDKNDISLSTETLDFHKYTKENYIQCLTKKLTQEGYGDFVVEQYIVPGDFHINSRFFYLKHYQILFWKPNYTENQDFYYFVALIGFYAVMSLAYIYFEKANIIQMEKLGSLKTEIAKMNMPYRREYNFNNDLDLVDEVRGRLKDKRNPDFEEMNLDVNNLDIQVMADEVSKYNKGYQNKDNALNFEPNFYAIKPKKKVDVNTKFFPGETDKRNVAVSKSENLVDDSERLGKMKKFYQVGFKGLDDTENNPKEMKLDKEKKKIYVGKKDNLDEIPERNEDDKDSGNYGNFFNDNDFDAETVAKKKSKKFQDNLKSYQNFVTNSEMDTDSNLKSSKRETKTKKFFGQNPPKKSGPVMGSYVFSEKDNQKVGKASSKFFSNNDDLDVKPKKKSTKNIFQKDYDNLYKPKFEGPKIVSENLGFYTRDTIDFEQEMDAENQHPPYFGHRFKKKKGEKEKEKKDENAGMRVGFKFKNRQVDLTNAEEELPKLSDDLDLEQLLNEFHDIDIYFFEFLNKNIKSRHILVTTFGKLSIVYARYQRVGNFVTQLALYAFFLSIFFTADAQQTAFDSQTMHAILTFILYCFASEVGACVVVHLPAYCFYVSDKKFRKLYNTLRENGGIRVLKEADEIINKGRTFWKILGVLIQLLFTFMGFYFSFGFCATYYYQRTTFILAIIVTIATDFFIFEFAWEILIGLLFYIRDVGRVICFIGAVLNKLRNIKHLV